MKNNFQSKAVPRGTRTIWRYLGALFLLFTFAIGNVWAADATVSPSNSATAAYYLGADGTAITSIVGSGAKQVGWNSGKPKITLDGKNNPDASIVFTIADGVTITSFTVNGTAQGNTTYKLDGAAVTFGTALGSLSKTGSMTFALHCTDASSSSSNRNTVITSIELSYTTGGGGGGCSSAPAAPTKFEAGSITENGVTFTITDAADAASYDIYYSTSSATPESTATATATSTAKTKAITGLTASTKYYAWVRSVCDDTHKSAWVALTGDFFTTAAPDPCTTHHWFVATADATANGKTNWDGFTNAVTGTSGQSNSVTIDGTTYNLTKRTGSTTGTDGIILGFTIPANKAGILYGYMKSSGTAARTLSLKKGDDVVKTNTEITDGNWTLITIDAIAPGTYTLSPDQNVQVQMFVLKICDATFRTITLEYADGVTPDGSLSVLDGTPATKPADPTWEHHRFAGWYNGSDPYDWSETVGGDLTLTAHWTQLYTVTYAAGDGTATGDAPTQVDKAEGETFKVAANTFAVEGKDFDKWNDGTNDYNPDDTYTVGTENVVLTAQWKTASAKYTVIFKDGDTELGTKLFEVGSVPSDAEIDKTKPMFTFAAWQKDDADIALDAEFWATVVKDATVTLTARWAKAFATSVDLEGLVEASGTGADWQKYLSDHGYAFSTSNVSLDEKKDPSENKPYDNWPYQGLKAKVSGAYVEGNIEAGKLVIIKLGHMAADATVTIDGVAQDNASGLDAAEPAGAMNYYYLASEGLLHYETTNAGACVLKAITITDPFTVSFDANGGDDVASLNGTPSVTLPLPVKGTDSFLGWFDGETKVGMNGDKYTPTANIELVAHWEAVSTDARLASITFSSDAGTLSPAFDPEVTSYTYTMPYGTAAIPTITSATSVNAKAQDPIIGEAAAAWSGTQTIQGVAQSGDKKTYTITMAKAPKDGVVIIHADIPSGTSADYAATGLYAGTGNSKNEGSSLKLGTNHYAGVNLSGSEIFKEGDILNIHVKTKNGFVKAPISTTNAVDGSGVIFTEERSFVVGDNFITLTSAFEDAKSSSLYLVRTTAVDTECNPAVDYIEVTRAMNPVLTAITINERAGVIDPLDDKHFSVTIPYEADLAALTVVPTIVRNAPHATTPEQVMTNSGAWVLTADGDNTYRIMDKDGDYTDYTITLIRDVLKHTVRFMDGASVYASDDQVEDGATVTAPATDPTKDEYIFKGWSETVDGEVISDWSAITITADKDFYAIWEAEPAGIKLFTDLGLNTTNFISAAKATDSVEINTVKYPYLVAFGSNRPSLAEAKQADLVMYSATTDATKIKFDLYNTNGSAKTAYVWLVEEGDDEATQLDAIEVAGTTRVKTAYYEFNGTKNRTVYLTSGAKADIKVLQAKVIESGSAIHQFGQAGYVVDFNKGRIAGVADGTVSFEGAAITMKSDYKVLNSTSLSPKTYIQFNNPVANTIVKIKRSGSNKYYVTNDLDNKGTEYSSNQEITLTATGTWYIGSVNPGSAAQITKIEFIAPKCAEPAFNALTNSDICSGDPYVALDGTATVADEGTPTYKWYAEGADESDPAAVLATTATYTPSADGKYYVIATNHLAGFSDNTKKSDLVTVTTHAGTAITEGLVDLRGAKDAEVTLTVTATGKNLHYAWKESATIDGTYTDVPGAADAASLNVTITEGMNKYYKVVVTSGCGDPQESIANVTQFVPVSQQDVTASIVWDWSEAASVNEIKLTSGTTPKKNEGFVMANGAATIYNNANFESDKLYLEGEYIIRTEGGKLFQGQTIKFHTTVAGIVRVKFSHTGTNKPARELFVNGVGTGDSRTNTTAEWSRYVEVPAGDVSLTAFHVDPADGAGQQYIRVYEIEFLEIIDSRTEYAAKDLGTTCYEYDALVIGATPYMIAGLNESGYIVFDEIPSGELEAGKPYLFEADGGQIFFCKPIGVTAAPLTSGDEITVKGMVGTFSGTTLAQGADDLCYFSGRHLWRVNDFMVGVPIPEHRCYVNYDVLKAAGPASAPASGRRRISMGVNGKDEAQGLEDLQSGDQPMKVMIDGTLYIIRGEKVFDATGRLVK